jgi:hypothetical protein
MHLVLGGSSSAQNVTLGMKNWMKKSQNTPIWLSKMVSAQGGERRSLTLTAREDHNNFDLTLTP